MTEAVENVVALATKLERYRRLCTGTTFGQLPDLRGSSGGSFDGLVSDVYQWYWEVLQEDRRFLAERANASQKGVLASFDRAIRDQRHDRQHVDYNRSAEAQQWRERQSAASPGKQPSDAALIDALLVELGGAIQVLCDLALGVSKEPSRALEWREVAAMSPEAEVMSVYRNLGLQPASGTLGYAVRTYSRHPRLRHAKTISDRAQVAEAVVMGVSFAPLSVDYQELIDSFGLIGDQAAQSLLLLAHGIESSGHRRESTVSVLNSVWPLVNAANSI